MVMGQFKGLAVVGSSLATPVKTLRELVKQRTQRNRNLTELKNLNSFLLEDIGLFECTREQFVRFR